MFYCRENELAFMNKRYEKGQFECIIIYGRRRVGKTALINEFCKDKHTIFFSALNASSAENLEALSKVIFYCDNNDTLNAPVFNNYQDALNAITEKAKKERLVFVIDEYPYLQKSEKSFSSILQHTIDHVWQNSNIYVILCGSSMSFMEYQVLGYESPLYGRRTAQLKIQALSYLEMTQFHPDLSLTDQALLYGITDGIPHYINKLDIETDINTALLDNLFTPSSYLFEEPDNLLKQELREPAIYNSVISAIAGGASKLNEIASKSGLETGVCTKYIRVLMSLGIIKKETPVSEKPGKKTIYMIDDNFFRFWYRFVPKNMSAIVTGRVNIIYDKIIRPYLSDYMGQVFEKICREYLLRYADNLPVIISDVGRWWGNDPCSKKEIEIDIVGIPAEGNKYLIGSCKYRNEKTGVDEFELLKKYANALKKDGEFYYYIFSKSGFTGQLIESAKKENITLLTLEDIYMRAK